MGMDAVVRTMLESWCEAMPFAVFVLRDEGQLVAANRQAKDLLAEELRRPRGLGAHGVECMLRGTGPLAQGKTLLCRNCWKMLIPQVLGSEDGLARRPCLLGGEACQSDCLTHAVASAKVIHINGDRYFVVVVEFPEMASTRSLAVCSYCQRVRVADGWQPMGSYLSQNFALSLTHGICPECVRESRFSSSGPHSHE